MTPEIPKAKHPVLSVLNSFEAYRTLTDALYHFDCPANCFGLTPTHKTHFVGGLFSEFSSTVPLLFVLPTEAECITAEEQLIAYDIPAQHFPIKSMSIGSDVICASGGTGETRMNVLFSLLEGKHICVVISAEALMQALPHPDSLRDSCIVNQCGDTLNRDDMLAKLRAIGYERTEVCEAKGQFSVSGGIIDVYPINYEFPVRIELFGDEIDTMRYFDPTTQRSTKNCDSLKIDPALEMNDEMTGSSSIIDYMPEGTLIVIDEPVSVFESASNAYELFSQSVSDAAEIGGDTKWLWKLYHSPNDIMAMLGTDRTVMLFAFMRTFTHIKPKLTVKFDARSVPQYNGNIAMIAADIKALRAAGSTVIVYAGINAAALHSKLIAEDIMIAYSDSFKRSIVFGEAIVVADSLPVGFEYRDNRFVLITEHELVGYKQKVKPVSQAKKAKSDAASKMLLSTLSVGDFVVHETHGIGRYMGIEALTVEDKTRDYILVLYASNDKLFIPTDQLDKLQKYVGGDENLPKLSKLGSGEWQRTVKRVKEGVKALAFDLVRLYGERTAKTGFAFSHDTAMQRQLEDSFPYDETPDQLTCIDEIKSDMESPKIMDRLLCGDVGFGKTEVALRMAFKCVGDSKQAAFLVPTTVLAHQHFNTLSSRFAPYPVKVDFLSRFKSLAEQKVTIDKLNRGEIDVIVGTHRLLSKDVKFHDLGLLVVDEEQRFGVGHKEIIKELKKTVDVLTLTATPIPRTLHMSLIGIRDISVIETPPSQRYPVQTYVTEYTEGLVRDAVLKEIGRGGQVYFLYNNVRNMERFHADLCKLLPGVRIRYAHGQMKEKQLEDTMLAFLQGEFDVLLCSTIIENGLDISNVNTIIIYDADKLGLSQLYQLRGRVGRSTRLGYAYLTFKRDKVFSEDAQKRLLAIREFTQLGMGYKIAMRDLQIRGAGNLLGAEQHGHMSDVGYEMYRRLMNEAVKEVRGGYVAPKERPEVSMEIAIDAYIPKSYIRNDDSRLTMYKRIALVRTSEDLMDVQDELIDRYGDIPQPVINLLTVAHLKSMASDCYVTRLNVCDDMTTLEFASDAPFNIDLLMQLVHSYPEIKLKNEDSPTIIIPQRGVKLLQGCQKLKGFLSELAGCIERVN